MRAMAQMVMRRVKVNPRTTIDFEDDKGGELLFEDRR